MERIEITPATIDRFDNVAEDLARAYQIAFARKKELGGWGEISKCVSEACPEGVGENPVGDECAGCGNTLVEAYDAVELANGWRNMILDEDTFANRELQPSGNLVARGRTLARIALRYAGDDIATRTIEPRIIGAIARDAGVTTDLYIGTRNIGLNQVSRFRSSGVIPDWRSALVIGGKELL